MKCRARRRQKQMCEAGFAGTEHVSVDSRQAGGEEKCARSMFQLLPSSTWNLDTTSASSYLTVISPPSRRLRSRGSPGSQLSGCGFFGAVSTGTRARIRCRHWRASANTFVKYHVSTHPTTAPHLTSTCHGNYARACPVSVHANCDER